MGKGIIFLLLAGFISVAVYIFICMPVNHSDLRPSDGVLDLRGVELSETIFPLAGIWNVTFNDEYVTTYDAPGDSEFFQNSGYGLGDKAVYELTVLADDDNVTFDLFVPQILDSCEIKINGSTVFSSDGVRNALVNFKTNNGVAEIEIITINHVDAKNGRYGMPKIAVSPYLLNDFVRQRVSVAFVLGAFLMIGLYHLMLYFSGNRNRIYLIFATLCIILVGKILLDDDGLLLWFLPNIHVEWFRILNLLICLQGIALFAFTSLAFKLQYRRAEKILLFILFAIPCVATLVFPLHLATSSALFAYTPMLIYLAKITWGRQFLKDPYLLFYYISISLFMLSGVYMVFFSRSMYLYSFSITCNTFMILSQCFLLSRNYAKALHISEELNLNLENQVNERTKQIAETNEKLIVSQNALREIIGNISHDLKTPLTVLSQYLELLDDGTVPLDDKERSDYIHVAYNKNLNMQRLIRNLFEVTCIESGQLVYNLGYRSLKSLLSEIEDKYAKYAESHGLTFSVVCGRACQIKFDSDKIWSVFDNIVYNAIRHTPQGGSVSVTAKYANSICVIEIADTGKGIPAEHLPYIFERFYKVDKSRSGNTGDSGIGLYIAKTNVLCMEGKIEVHSEVEKGSVFTVSFVAKD